MNECCANPNNLEVVEDERPDVVVRQCKVCSCRHIEFGIDPVEIGMEFS